MNKKKLELKSIWKNRLRLRTEGNKLCAEGKLLKGEKITISETRIDEEKLRNFLGDLMVKENMSFQIVGCGHPQDILNYVAHAISQQSGGLMK